MFSQASVCPGGFAWRRGGAGEGHAGGGGVAGETATAADGTHPTCSILFSFQYYSMLFNCSSDVAL